MKEAFFRPLFPKRYYGKNNQQTSFHPSAVSVSSLGMLEHEQYCGKTNCVCTDFIWLFICCINFFLFTGIPWLSSCHSFSLLLAWWHHSLKTQNKEEKWTATLTMPPGRLREDIQHSHPRQEDNENVRKMFTLGESFPK